MSVSKNNMKIATVAFMPVSELELDDLVATCKFVQAVCGDQFSQDQLFFATLHDLGQNFFTLSPSAKSDYRFMRDLPQKLSVEIKYYDPSWRPVDFSTPGNLELAKPFISKVSFCSRMHNKTSFLNEEVLVIRKADENGVSLQAFSESIEDMLSDFVLTNSLFEIQQNALSMNLNNPQGSSLYERHGPEAYHEARNQTLRDIKEDIIQHLEDQLPSILEESNSFSTVDVNKQDLFECLKAECLDFYEVKKKVRSLINSLPKPRWGERSSEIDSLLFLERLLGDFTHSQQSFAALLDEQFLTGVSVITKKCRSGDVAAWSTSSFRISKNLYTPNESIGHTIINSMRDAGERRDYLVPYKEFCKERLNSTLWDKKDGELWGAFLDDKSLFLHVITQWLERLFYSAKNASCRVQCEEKLQPLKNWVEGIELPLTESLFSFIMIGRIYNIIPREHRYYRRYTSLVTKLTSQIIASSLKEKHEAEKEALVQRERVKTIEERVSGTSQDIKKLLLSMSEMERKELENQIVQLSERFVVGEEDRRNKRATIEDMLNGPVEFVAKLLSGLSLKEAHLVLLLIAQVEDLNTGIKRVLTQEEIAPKLGLKGRAGVSARFKKLKDDHPGVWEVVDFARQRNPEEVFSSLSPSTRRKKGIDDSYNHSTYQ